MNWFDVDKAGLAKLLERRGKAFAITELVQNAWDTDAKRVEVFLQPLPGVAICRIEVRDDDPHGFANMAHAFTLFAESEKKGDATKRGRFNLGEKLVLALCTEAQIASTSGTIVFDAEGRRQTRHKLEQGSRFVGTIRMTRAELEEALRIVQSLIPPPGIETTVNGEPLRPRSAVAVLRVSLPTEVADEEGVLRRAERTTEIRVYEPLEGETPSVYELGIPVVETGDRWHVNVEQKVPLSLERDNLPPAYLRRLRVLVLNELQDQLTKKDANATWVRDAGSDKDASDLAVKRIMDLRFGEKRVAYDPSDVEANSRAVAAGYTVVHGGMLNAHEWANAKRAEAVKPAGQVTPSPRPYSPDGAPLTMVPPEKWTAGIRRVVQFARDFAREAMGLDNLEVDVVNEIAWPFNATYGHGVLRFNLGRLGHRWFDEWTDDVEALLIHEFAHHYEDNHLSEAYFDACCKLGARLARLALEQPELWKDKP